jgi:serine/threonine-protein kinase
MVEVVCLSSGLNSSNVLKRLLTVIFLVGVFGLSSLVVMYFALRGRTVEVPNIVGKTEADAEIELRDAGLRIKVISRAYNNKVPANTVSDQSPAPGEIVKTGQQVRVSLSLGASAPSP